LQVGSAFDVRVEMVTAEANRDVRKHDGYA